MRGRFAAGCRTGRRSADRLRRCAVHPGVLSRRGRPQPHTRAHQGDDAGRTGELACADVEADRPHRRVPARANRGRGGRHPGVRFVGGNALAGRLPPVRAATQLAGFRHLGRIRRAHDALRGRNRRAAGRDVGGPETGLETSPSDGRRRGLANLPGRRGRARRGRHRAAGQPRSGRAVGGLAGRGPRRAGCGRRRTPRRRRRCCRPRLQPRPRGAAGDRSRRADRAGVAGPLAMTGRSYCVVGGGISGLTAAYRLRAAAGDDAAITLFDPAGRLGGVLRTETVGGRAMDVGAEAFVLRRPEMPALLAELGLSELQLATTGARPLIYSRRELHPLPTGTVVGIPSSASSVAGLVDETTIARIDAEPARPLVWQPGGDPAVAELVGDRFGEQVVARSVDPLLSGVYAGSASTIGLRAAAPGVAAALDGGAGPPAGAPRRRGCPADVRRGEPDHERVVGGGGARRARRYPVSAVFRGAGGQWRAAARQGDHLVIPQVGFARRHAAAAAVVRAVRRRPGRECLRRRAAGLVGERSGRGVRADRRPRRCARPALDRRDAAVRPRSRRRGGRGARRPAADDRRGGQLPRQHRCAGLHRGGRPRDRGRPAESGTIGFMAKLDYDALNSQLRYLMFSVFSVQPGALGEQRDAVIDDASTFFKLQEDHDVVVRGLYDVAGLRADADFMIWTHAARVEALQATYADFRRTTTLGRACSPVWSSVALHRPAEFNKSHIPAFLAGEEPGAYICVYPFVRSYEWYLLPDEERRRMLAEHGMAARGYKDVRANTVPAFALGDYEWILAFEAPELDRIVDLMRELRATDARRHTRAETPFFTGPRVPVEQLVNSLP